MGNGKNFAANVSAFVKKANGNADLVVRKIVLDIGTAIVMRSPVGDGDFWKSPPPKGYVGGRFRANWQYGNISEPTGELPNIDKTGKESIDRIAAGLPAKAAGLVHMLRNNLPYAERLETGWSKQAPAGMVGLTVAEFQTFVTNAAKDLT